MIGSTFPPCDTGRTSSCIPMNFISAFITRNCQSDLLAPAAHPGTSNSKPFAHTAVFYSSKGHLLQGIAWKSLQTTLLPLFFLVTFPPKLIVKSLKATKEERQHVLSLPLQLTCCHATLSFSLSMCICSCLRHISETNQGGRSDKCLLLRKSAWIYLHNEIFVLNNHIAFMCPSLLPLVHNINTYSICWKHLTLFNKKSHNYLRKLWSTKVIENLFLMCLLNLP